MKVWEVRVELDEDEVGTWLVHAESEEAACAAAVDYVRPSLQASALIVRYPDKVDSLDYDGVIGAP
jgi:hypothetical protein